MPIARPLGRRRGEGVVEDGLEKAEVVRADFLQKASAHVVRERPRYRTIIGWPRHSGTGASVSGSNGSSAPAAEIEANARNGTPPGFGFSDTAFRVFILMASRRLKSDRFFTDDFRPEVYTQAGFAWVRA